jgi:hypothetical protein
VLIELLAARTAATKSQALAAYALPKPSLPAHPGREEMVG